MQKDFFSTNHFNVITSSLGRLLNATLGKSLSILAVLNLGQQQQQQQQQQFKQLKVARIHDNIKFIVGLLAKVKISTLCSLILSKFFAAIG